MYLDLQTNEIKGDHDELLNYLCDWSIGKSSEIFYRFYYHLNRHGLNDGFEFLEKDLLFLIDIIRLKEINNKEILKQKAKIIIKVYLKPKIIDVNTDILSKLLKAAYRITQNDYVKYDLFIFEEAKIMLTKELLIHYWGKLINSQYYY